MDLFIKIKMQESNPLEKLEKKAKKVFQKPSIFDDEVQDLEDKDKLIILSILESKLLSKLLNTSANSQQEIAKQLR